MNIKDLKPGMRVMRKGKVERILDSTGWDRQVVIVEWDDEDGEHDLTLHDQTELGGFSVCEEGDKENEKHDSGVCLPNVSPCCKAALRIEETSYGVGHFVCAACGMSPKKHVSLKREILLEVAEAWHEYWPTHTGFSELLRKRAEKL